MNCSPDNNTDRSFAPLTGKVLRTLVLGTMPGQRSLALQQYYAHPRNALWPILCGMASGSKPDYRVHELLTYKQRCALITNAGYGLWDVLASCTRPGSLDANIERGTQTPNNIASLLAAHPELQIIACNGRTAEKLFQQYILPTLNNCVPRVVYVPSSSAAMAALSLQEKYDQWRTKISETTATDGD